MADAQDPVAARALALFGAEHAGRALALVAAYGVEPHEREVTRVRLAILELADGRLTRLPYFVKCAKIDPRDVLVGARLGPMTDAEEARWQAGADRLLALWNPSSAGR